LLAGCAANDSEVTGAIPPDMLNQPLTKGPAPPRKPAVRPAPPVDHLALNSRWKPPVQPRKSGNPYPIYKDG